MTMYKYKHYAYDMTFLEFAREYKQLIKQFMKEPSHNIFVPDHEDSTVMKLSDLVDNHENHEATMDSLNWEDREELLNDSIPTTPLTIPVW